ncbi:MAG: hypothetical protein LAN59_02550 [Acidobacteriia bacterium]|nr:hypothetical protein [Terriglobia bacterium]
MSEQLIDWAQVSVGYLLLLGVYCLPAFAALAWMWRRSKYGVDWGPRQKLLTIGLTAVAICVLVVLFGYVYSSWHTGMEWMD